jgi:hypothetical protein
VARHLRARAAAPFHLVGGRISSVSSVTEPTSIVRNQPWLNGDAMRAVVILALLALVGCGGTNGVTETVVADGTASAEADGAATDGPTGFTPDASGFETVVGADTGAWDALSGDAPPTEPGCVDCFTTYCKGFFDTCYKIPVCVDQIDCRLGCVDEACAKRCREMYPSSQYDDYLACMSKHCTDTCGL